MKGLEAREEKKMREIEEKMKPTAVSLRIRRKFKSIS